MGTGRARAEVDTTTTRTARRRTIRRTVQLIGLGLVTTAVVKELRTPTEQRTWHGDLAGLVPYDLRPPTLVTLRERVWSPDDPHVIVPRAFGVGWTVNVGRVVWLARHRHSASD